MDRFYMAQLVEMSGYALGSIYADNGDFIGYRLSRHGTALEFGYQREVVAFLSGHVALMGSLLDRLNAVE